MPGAHLCQAQAQRLSSLRWVNPSMCNPSMRSVNVIKSVTTKQE